MHSTKHLKNRNCDYCGRFTTFVDRAPLYKSRWDSKLRGWTKSQKQVGWINYRWCESCQRWSNRITERTPL